MTTIQELQNKSKDQLIKQIVDAEITDNDRKFIQLLKKHKRLTLYELKTDHGFDSASAHRTLRRLEQLGIIDSEKYTDKNHGQRAYRDYFLARLLK